MTASLWTLRSLALLFGLFAAAGCGDDAGGDPARAGSGDRDAAPDADRDAQAGPGPAEGGGSMTAIIDGRRWEAAPGMVRSRVDDDVPGGYEFEGTGNVLSRLTLALYYVDSTGSYDVGVGGSVVGAAASYASGATGMIWQTPGSGDAGTLEVETFGEGRIAGTFEFTLVPVPGSAARSMVTVEAGEFDLELPEGALEVGPGFGRSVSAEFDGERFNAATVVVTPNAGGFSFNAINDRYNVGFMIGEADGPGTYPLALGPPFRGVVVVAADPAKQENCCWGNIVDDSGSITVTTFSSDRLTGSFEFTLAPGAMGSATEPLVATSGVFDIGLRDP
jgi:hypothetical protein